MASGEKPNGSGSNSKAKKKLPKAKELKNTRVQQKVVGGARSPASAEHCTENTGCEQSDFCKTAGCP